MNKKLLAPLLVTLALVVMLPAASQGAPHVYKNGVIGAEGKKVKLVEVICHNIFAGYAENPLGGGAAKGFVQAFFPYECEEPACATSKGELEVKPGKTLYAEPAQLQPAGWKAEVIEPKAGEFWQKTGFKGPTPNVRANPKLEPGQIEFEINCSTIGKFIFFGENLAKVLNNGLAIGAGPGELELKTEASDPTKTSKDLETEGGLGKGETEGPVKVEGYGEEELLEVKNP